MPDSTDLVKIAVDNAYDVAGAQVAPEQIAGGDRRQHFYAGVAQQIGRAGQGRPDMKNTLHSFLVSQRFETVQ
ncbi:hypothetical protein GCM10010429_33860 [Micromonospora olivasterospora]